MFNRLRRRVDGVQHGRVILFSIGCVGRGIKILLGVCSAMSNDETYHCKQFAGERIVRLIL
jgi:hypothetical protein